MNYQRIHNFIIDRAKNRDISGYVERHHIKPRCLGGSNEPENLVRLTAKEHYLIHRLLTRIYPEEPKLVYAYWFMCSSARKHRFIPSPKTYAHIKEQMSIVAKERLKIHNPWIDRKHSEESRKKQSEAAKKRNISPEMEELRRQKIRESMKGKKKSKEHSENISKSKQGEKNPMFGKTKGE